MECWSHKAFNVGEDAEEPREEVEAQEGCVDSVWLVAGVETKRVNPPGLQKAGETVSKTSVVRTRLYEPIPIKNKFQALAERQINMAEKTAEKTQQPRKCGLTFHMTDAKRMLASVDKIVAAGHKVNFAEEAKDCFIEHVDAGDKIYMQREIWCSPMSR